VLLDLDAPGRSPVTRRIGRPAPVRLADQLFLAAHDHDTGYLQARLHKAGMELGLAGALLCELVIERRIDVQQGRIVLVSRAPMQDILAQTVLEDIVTELHVAKQPHTVKIWLAYLSHSAVTQVRNRLCFTGFVDEVPGRRRWWGGTANRYRAANINAALGPEASMHSLLTHGQHTQNTNTAMTFAALSDACGLLPKLTWWHEQRLGMRRKLQHIRDQLPRALRELVDETEAAVGDAVMGRR
jgi:hypothetical protein